MNHKFIIITTLSLASCLPPSIPNRIEGVYDDIGEKNQIRISCHLELKKDRTFSCEKSFDLFKQIGYGNWDILDKMIVLHFDSLAQTPIQILASGGVMKGIDTLTIVSKNKLRWKEATLKKRYFLKR